MRIEDASDRVYQGRVYRLLDEARSSIVISMYLIRPGEDAKHPVNRLLEDLVEARRRGVKVAIYMNTKFKGRDRNPKNWAEGPWFDRLRRAGVKIHPVSPVRRLHDKLLIVDKRFVVEGSMNWTVSAIGDNFESATIIESPELAATKLRRISFFPIWGREAKKIPLQRRVPKQVPELFPSGQPTSIEVPAALVEEKKYFPSMISSRRERAMKLFLLLLYLAEARGGLSLGISLAVVAKYLEVLPGEDRSAVRRQIIKVLRKLEQRDGLIRVKFRHGKPARVEPILPAGPAFTVGSEDLVPGELSGLTDNEIFMRLIRARLREEGKGPQDFTRKAIKERFFFDVETLRHTVKKRRAAKRLTSKPAPVPI